jgi:hypothetical protein
MNIKVQQEKLGKWFVPKLGKLVGEAVAHAQSLGLSKDQTRKVLLTTFEILNKKGTPCKCPAEYHDTFVECRGY